MSHFFKKISLSISFVNFVLGSPIIINWLITGYSTRSTLKIPLFNFTLTSKKKLVP